MPQVASALKVHRDSPAPTSPRAETQTADRIAGQRTADAATQGCAHLVGGSLFGRTSGFIEARCSAASLIYSNRQFHAGMPLLFTSCPILVQLVPLQKHHLGSAADCCCALIHSRLTSVFQQQRSGTFKMTNLNLLTTINDLFLRVAAAGNPRAILWQDQAGHWQPISSDQIYQRVRRLARTLLEWGETKGSRIALISENRWEWGITDFAILAIGAVNVPIYP